MDIRRFSPADLDSVIALCVAEGWQTFAADPGRAARALTAPGVTTMVAIDETSQLVGFAQMLGDGEIQAYLAALAVHPRARGRGVGRALVSEAFRHAGGTRVDLLSAEDAVGFYNRFEHRRVPGFRVYPQAGGVGRLGRPNSSR